MCPWSLRPLLSLHPLFSGLCTTPSMMATSSARRADTVAPSGKDWPRCTPGSQSPDLDCAESRWQSCWARRASRCPVYYGHLPHVEEKPRLSFQPHRLASSGPCAHMVLPFCPADFPAHWFWASAWKVRGRDYLHRGCFFFFFLKETIYICNLFSRSS